MFASDEDYTVVECTCGDHTLWPCPFCEQPSVYSVTLDRLVHADGTDNRECWVHMSRGE